MSDIFYVGIDPSTKTGLVILNNKLNVLRAEELQLPSKSNADTAEIQQFGRSIAEFVPSSSIICIEGFAYGAHGSAVSLQYGIGYAIRFALNDLNKKYIDVSPSQLKKFTTSKGTSKKEVMIKEVYKRWQFENDSNNVIDAYALARYAHKTVEE